MTSKTAIIIGAGPAGLTAALELLKRTDIKPVVLEASDAIGGISRTVNYKGNRMDIGGHRFFSKSDRVMDVVAGHYAPRRAPKATKTNHRRTYRKQTRSVDPAASMARTPTPPTR